MLFDSHCHLDFAALRSDLPEQLSLAEAKGVGAWFVPGCAERLWGPGGAARWQEIRAAAHHRSLFFGVGQHPYFLDELTDLSGLGLQIDAASRSPLVVAIGECGLDKDRGGAVGKQVQVFELHLEIARQRGLPVVCHQVGLREAFLACLKKMGSALPPLLVHGFSGDEAWARALLSRGCLLGVGAGAIRPARRRLHRALRGAPLSRLLLETDAPDQCARPGQPPGAGRPDDLPIYCRGLAQILELSEGEVGRVTSGNAACFFGVPAVAS